MPRTARIILERIPYHVTQRGNGRRQIFFSESDYRLYLGLLQANSTRFCLQVLAYCLMPNHVHLIVIPDQPQAMASTLARTHAGFARHFNLQRHTSGHVWQARFFSTPLDEAHLGQATAYIERNPVRARLAPTAWQYPWSSAAPRLGLSPPTS